MHKPTEMRYSSSHKHADVDSSSVTEHSSPGAKSCGHEPRSPYHGCRYSSPALKTRLNAYMHDICGQAAIEARQELVPPALEWLCLYRVVELCGHTCEGGRRGGGGHRHVRSAERSWHPTASPIEERCWRFHQNGTGSPDRLAIQSVAGREYQQE